MCLVRQVTLLSTKALSAVPCYDTFGGPLAPGTSACKEDTKLECRDAEDSPLTRSRSVRPSIVMASPSVSRDRSCLEVISASCALQKPRKEEATSAKSKRENSPACVAKKQRITRVNEKNIHDSLEQMEIARREEKQQRQAHAIPLQGHATHRC